MNAITHGLTGETIVIEGENSAEFEALRFDLDAEFEPDSPWEKELVDRLAGLLWRLRRVPRFEAALLKGLQTEVRRDLASEYTMWRTGSHPKIPYFGAGCQSNKKVLEAQETWKREHEGLANGEALLGLALITDAKSSDALGKLSRYERTLVNTAARIVRQLEIKNNQARYRPRNFEF